MSVTIPQGNKVETLKNKARKLGLTEDAIRSCGNDIDELQNLINEEVCRNWVSEFVESLKKKAKDLGITYDLIESCDEDIEKLQNLIDIAERDN